MRVFQQKYSEFKKEVAARLGPILYSINVTEFQKRSLPHAHLAISLKYVPTQPHEIDQFLSAELPRDPGPLRDAIARHMIHQHNPEKDYHRCSWPKKPCQYGFPKDLKAESSFDERGNQISGPYSETH